MTAIGTNLPLGSPPRRARSGFNSSMKHSLVEIAGAAAVDRPLSIFAEYPTRIPLCGESILAHYVEGASMGQRGSAPTAVEDGSGRLICSHAWIQSNLKITP